MLDLCADQGVGLRRIAMNSCAKAIAVASHGSQNGELPLLWSLCTTLVELGHTVTVLDGTMEEQPNEPGLMLGDVVSPSGSLTISGDRKLQPRKFLAQSVKALPGRGCEVTGCRVASVLTVAINGRIWAAVSICFSARYAVISDMGM